MWLSRLLRNRCRRRGRARVARSPRLKRENEGDADAGDRRGAYRQQALPRRAPRGHAEAPSPSSAVQDAKFLRGRAEVLRRLALTATSLEAAGKLLQTARELDHAASAMERGQRAPSIRKGH